MSQENKINIVYKIKCPCCGKDINASLDMAEPTINWVEASEVIEKIKKEMIEKVDKLTLSTPEREAVLAWLNDERTCILPSDVEDAIKNITG
jgi:hypothetical protein